MGVTSLSLKEAAELVRRRSVSPVELTQACLERIEKLNPELNAFITVTADSALARARAAEEEIGRDGWKGPLHGIPAGVAWSIVFSVQGQDLPGDADPVRCGCHPLAG